MKKIKLSILSILFFFSLISFPSYVKGYKNIPEFYGVFLVADGRLIELKKIGLVRKSNQVGFNQNPKIDINDIAPYFIVYKKGINPENFSLAKLKFLETKIVEIMGLGGSKSPAFGYRKKTVNFNLWVLDKILKFKIVPVSGKNDMYKLIPRRPLEPGVYALPSGLLGELSTDIYSANIAASIRKSEYGELYNFSLKIKKYEAVKAKNLSKIQYKGQTKDIENILIRGEYEKFDNTDIESLLIILKKDKDSELRKRAAQALGSTGNRRTVNSLISALKKDKDIMVRTSAVKALGNIGGRRAIKALSRALQNKDLAVRKNAARALEVPGNKRAVNSLIAVLKDKNSDIRGVAAISLARIGDKRSVEPIMNMLKELNYSERKQVKRELNKLGWDVHTTDLVMRSDNKIPTIRTLSNIRSGPGTTYSVISKVPKGYTLEILKDIDDWYKVKLQNGKVGFISRKLVIFEKSKKFAYKEDKKKSKKVISKNNKSSIPSTSPLVLHLKRTWSGKNVKENIIALTYRNVNQKDNKISADVTLVNSIGTWVFVKQNLKPNNTAKYPVSGRNYTFLIGPFGSKKLGNIEFGSGDFLQLNAVSPIGLAGSLSSSTNTDITLLGAVAIDLMMRGFLKKELPPNAFDNSIGISVETGLASIDPLFMTIESNCSGPLGVFGKNLVEKDVEGVLGAIGDFALCTKKVKKGMTKFLTKYFSKNASEKFVKWASKNIVDLLDAPTREVLIRLLTKSTFTAPPESWVKIAAAGLKDEKTGDALYLMAKYKVVKQIAATVNNLAMDIMGNIGNLIPNRYYKNLMGAIKKSKLSEYSVGEFKINDNILIDYRSSSDGKVFIISGKLPKGDNLYAIQFFYQKNTGYGIMQAPGPMYYSTNLNVELPIPSSSRDVLKGKKEWKVLKIHY